MKIFVASTYDDLEEHREHLLKVLTRCEQTYKGMEFFGAFPRPALPHCLDQVSRSDIVVCLIGNRYGSRPENSDISFTEHEVDCAIANNIPIYPYFIDDMHPVPPKLCDFGQNYQALKSLKDKLRRVGDPCRFTTPPDLAAKVITDLFTGTTYERVVRPFALSDNPAKRFRETAYDSIATWYDYWYNEHWCDDKPFSTICKILEKSHGLPLDDLRKLSVLDVACGTGNTYAAFKRAGFEVYGSDGSMQMLLRAMMNCTANEIPIDGIIADPINWTDVDEYRRHFSERKFDIILVTANSFCHIPPVSEYMDLALSNFHRLLKPGGFLIIDTKRYIKEGDADGIPVYKELKYERPNWVVRTVREDKRLVPEVGEVMFHTRLHYDVDPSFSENVPRALIVLTVHSKDLAPQTALIPYYPLPAIDLKCRMVAAGFETAIYPARKGPAAKWPYDIVLGSKLS